MNLEQLFAGRDAAPVRYALTGAAGGYARTLLAQTTRMDSLDAAVLCDLDTDAVVRIAVEVGFDAGALSVCSTVREVEAAASAGRVAVVPTADLLLPSSYDILVEATGNPAFGHRVAADALRAQRHVAMVSKEVDSVVGSRLAELARRNGVVYTPAGGDQPANLIALLSWVRTLGFDVVAIGKSSEYDLVVDPEKGTVTQLDTTIDAPALPGLLPRGADLRATLEARAQAVAELPTGATADVCEMAVVATHTGLRADVERMHYPVARVAELADIYIPREEGGILEHEGVVDVFSALRTADEASFAGGVFVIVRTHDAPTWELLRGKGHVVSANGRYACIYLPYHFMGVETPHTLLAAVRLGIGSGPGTPGRTVVLAGRAKHDIAAGTVLEMGGHHHDVTGVQAVLLPAGSEDADDAAPLYLAAHARLARPVAAGAVIRIEDLADPDADLLAAWLDPTSA